MTETLSRARAVVSQWGLPVAQHDSIILSPEEASALQAFADHEHVNGLHWEALASGAITAGESAIGSAAEAHLQTLRHTLAVEAVAAEAIEALSRRGIPTRVLKGLAAAHIDYSDPSHRFCSDADILVPRADLFAALETLTEIGFTRTEPALAQWWEQRFGRAIVLASPEGAEVDLHAAIAVGYFGTVFDHTDLIEHGSERFELGGVEASALAGGVRLLSSCYAAVLGRGTHTRIFRDIAQQLLVSELDWLETADLARRNDGETVVSTALLRAAASHEIDHEHPALKWARTVSPSTTATKAMGLVDLGEKHGFRADARGALLALGATDRAMYLWGLVMRRRGARRTRDDTRTQHVAADHTETSQSNPHTPS